jgi:MFS family permease
MWKKHLADLFAQRQFIRFWLARVAGTMVNQMLMVAVAWQMYDVTSSAWDLGLVGLFQFVPALLLSFPAGHVVDRYHRGRIFAVCMLMLSVVALLLVAATQGGFVTRELLLGISVVLGAARAFQMPAQQALTPLLVPQELLASAIALSASGMQVAIICGPALGGALYVAGATMVYGCCTLFLLLACVFTLTIHYDRRRLSAVSTWRSAFAGVTYVWQRQILLGAISLDLFAVLLGGATALLPIYARDILQTGPIGLGLLRSAPAIGALIMSLALTRWPLQRRVGYRLLTAVGLFGLATIAFGLSTRFDISLIALAITGAADNISVVTRQTLMQLETPDEMRGRVAAVNSIFIGASNQLGEFESGATASFFGPVGSVVLGGVGTLLVAVTWWRLFPTLAKRDRMA